MTLDLPEKYKAELIPLLRRFAPTHDVLAFGSRINGKNHAGSDLDIVLRDAAAPDQFCGKMGALRDAISDSNIPILVDVHDWAALPASFRAEIERNHVKLYANSPMN